MRNGTAADSVPASQVAWSLTTSIAMSAPELPTPTTSTGPSASCAVTPVAAQLQQLGAVREALAAEGHEIGLGLPPSVERVGPLACAAKIQEPVTGMDHRAVHEAGDDR